MDIRKWYKRKFPKYYEEIFNNYKISDLEEFKRFIVLGYKYKLGRCKENIGKNKKGTLCFYHRTKEIVPEDLNGYEYPSNGGWSGEFEYCVYFPFSTMDSFFLNPSYYLLLDTIEGE